jgi:hypothetical protein
MININKMIDFISYRDLNNSGAKKKERVYRVWDKKNSREFYTNSQQVWYCGHNKQYKLLGVAKI